MQNATQRVGTLFMLLAATGYSFFSVWVKNIQATGMTPVEIGTWRFLIATAVIWAVPLALRHPKPAKPLPRLGLLFMGFLMALAALTGFRGLEVMPAGAYVVLFYSYPAMVALISFFLGERMSAQGWLALLLTSVGVVLTVPDIQNGLSGANLEGVIIALVNALIVSIYFLLSNRLLKGHPTSIWSSAWVMTGALAVFLAFAPFRAPRPPASTSTWLLLLALAIFSTAIPIFSLNAGIPKVGASRAAILGTIEPILTVIWATLLLGERMQPLQLVGGAFIIASIVLLQTPADMLRRWLRLTPALVEEAPHAGG
jgi:drug/metabolite transporter (DMT)-like permease